MLAKNKKVYIKKILLVTTLFLVTLFVSDAILYKYRYSFYKIYQQLNLKNTATSTPMQFSIESEKINLTQDPKLIEILKLNQRYGRNGIKAVGYTHSDLTKIGDLTIARNRLMSDTQSVIFDVNYTYDSLGRRITPKPSNSKNSDVAILLVGCSYIYGSGVQDNETIAAYLTQLTGLADIWNLGVGGNGPNDLLASLNVPEVAKRFFLNYKKIILIYGFMNGHLDRLACDFSCYGNNKNLLKKPRFELVDNQLSREGFHENYYSSHPFKLLFGQLQNFAKNDGLFKRINFDSTDNINLFNATLNEIKNKFSENYVLIDSYFIDLDLSTQSPLLEKIFTAPLPLNYKPIVLPLPEIYSQFKYTDLRIPIDYHPTPLAHYLTAQTIYSKLKKDHPEVFKP